MYRKFKKYIGPFDGGLITSRSKYDAGDNALIDGANITLDRSGRLTLRPCSVAINTETATAYPASGLYRAYKSDGTGKLVKVYSNKLAYLHTDNTFVDALAESDVSITSGNRYRFCVYNDVLYLVGGDAAYKWDLSNSHKVCKVGIAAPTVYATKDSDISGSMAAGNYMYMLKFYNSVYGTESPFGIASAVLAVTASGGIKLDIGAQAVTGGVDIVKIYRTEVGGSSFKYLGQAAYSGSAIEYSDGTNDSGLGLVGDTDCDAPPSGANYILSALNMIFLAGFSSYPNRLYYSRIGFPDYYTDETTGEARYLNVGRAEGDRITGLVYRNGKIYVFKESSIWSVSSPHNPHEVNIDCVNTRFGCLSGDSLAQDERFIYFVSAEGVMMLDNDGSVHRMSANIDPFFIGGGAAQISIDSLKQAAGVCHNNRYLLSYSTQRRDTAGKVATAVTETCNNTGNNDTSAVLDALGAVDYGQYTFTKTSSLSDISFDLVLSIPWSVPAREWESFTYKVYCSKDSRATWKLLGTFTQYAIQNAKLDGWDIPALSSYTHSFMEPGVTDIRVEPVSNEVASQGGQPSFFVVPVQINLVSVAYKYAATASFIPDSVLCFHTDRIAWNPFSKAFTAVVDPVWSFGTRVWAVQAGGRDLNELLFADGANTKVYRLVDGRGIDDGGAAISGWLRTAQIWFKGFGLVNEISLERIAGSGIATVEAFIDSASVGSFSFSFAPVDADDDLIVSGEVLDGSAEGRSIGFKVTAGGDFVGNIVRFGVAGMFLPEKF